MSELYGEQHEQEQANWEQWKTEVQKILYESDIEAKYVEQFSNGWEDYWKALFNQGMTPKQAYQDYIDSDTRSEEAP